MLPALGRLMKYLQLVWRGESSRTALAARDIAGNVVLGTVKDGASITQIVNFEPAPTAPAIHWRRLKPKYEGIAEIDAFNLLTWRSRLVEELVGRDADRHDLMEWAMALEGP